MSPLPGSRLGEILVGHGLLTRARLQEVLARQTVYGGALDTVLLEMNAVEEKRLWIALAQAHGCEVPPEVLFAASARDARLHLGEPVRSLAIRLGAVPLLDLDGATHLISCEASDGNAVSTMQGALGTPLQIHVVPEYRLRFELSRRAGTSLQARFAALARRFIGAAATPPRSPSLGGEPAPPPVRQVPPSLEELPAWDRMRRSRTEEDVLSCLCELACARLDAVALFSLVESEGGSRALLRAASRLSETLRGQLFEIELDRLPSLQAIVKSPSPYLGPLDPDCQAALAPLGRSPKVALLLTLRNELGAPLALLYGDRGERSPRMQDVADVRRVCAEAARLLGSQQVRKSVPPDRPAPRPAPPPDPDALARRILAGLERHESVALERLHALGDAGLDALLRRFPAPDEEAAGRMGRALRLFGPAALPPLLRLLSHEDPRCRIGAAQALGTLGEPGAVPAFGQHLDDEDAGVREAVAAGLRQLGASFAPGALIAALQAMVQSEDPETARAVVIALGALGEGEAVPLLVEQLKHTDRALADAAHRALVLLTKQDFGRSRWRWSSWWDKNHMRPRVEWLLDGLAHKEAEIRWSASEELKQVTDVYFGYHYDLPKREREEARRRWVSWWQESGRSRWLARQGAPEVGEPSDREPG